MTDSAQRPSTLPLRMICPVGGEAHMHFSPHHRGDHMVCGECRRVLVPATSAPATGATPRTERADVTKALEARQNATDAATKLIEDGFPAAADTILNALHLLDRTVVQLERELAEAREARAHDKVAYERIIESYRRTPLSHIGPKSNAEGQGKGLAEAGRSEHADGALTPTIPSAPSSTRQIDPRYQGDDPAAEYAKRNPLGGPAKVFDAMASRIRAGEDYYSVLADYGFAVSATVASMPSAYTIRKWAERHDLSGDDSDLFRIVEDARSIHD